MFGSLTEKLQSILARIGPKRTLTEENLSEAVREVRLALLEADVNYSVAKTLVQRVKERVVGQELIRSVSPGQQFAKILHDELAALMGEGESSLTLSGKPAVILLCGLQGAGKTTHCAKLGRYLARQGRRPLLAACDLQRPAAVAQLRVLAGEAELPVFTGEGDPLVVARGAVAHANAEGHDVLIVDTAGRLHVDEELMGELARLKRALSPQEVLFVANAMTGQDAVNSAAAIHERVGITGTILSMLDGSTRAGAAISIREVTGMPLKFEGIGERLEDLQVFNPISMAHRILGMGDTINLVKAAQEQIDEKEAEALEKKMRRASFTYDDYLGLMGKFEKMGSMRKLLSMLPGGINGAMLNQGVEEMGKIRAIIQSMTPYERMERDALDIRRRRRVARGSGTDLDEVNRMVKGFQRAKKLFKKTKKGVPAWG